MVILATIWVSDLIIFFETIIRHFFFLRCVCGGYQLTMVKDLRHH